MLLTTASTDSELAEGLIVGDPAAPRLVWQRFLPMVRRMSRRALGPGQEVDDVVQEVFCCLFHSAPRLRAPGAFRAFVMTVTKRTLGHEVYKRRARARLHSTTSVELSEVIGEWSDPATRHAYRHFEHLLGRLTERERRAFVLRFVACMDAPEVAQSLGVSVPTARRAFARAQLRLTRWAGRHPFLSDYLSESALAEGAELPAAIEDTAA
ncbi:MAG TPA: sigma-70 family RNA polymerase sigma factor [Polyangiaceae bacterium]|nr:sigma-70 family RNA polymerase sigma factor [Polyangiaceae bacterium]